MLQEDNQCPLTANQTYSNVTLFDVPYSGLLDKSAYGLRRIGDVYPTLERKEKERERERGGRGERREFSTSNHSSMSN